MVYEAFCKILFEETSKAICFGFKKSIRIKFQFAVLVPSRVWGTARPNKKLSQGAENFQELKICGHGTILVLYVFLKGLKELR